jgi:Ring finger domain
LLGLWANVAALLVAKVKPRMEQWMRTQGYDMDQSLATKFQALLGATTTSRPQQQQPRIAPTAGYGSLRVYTEEQLQAMGMVELRNALRSLGLSNLGPLPKWQLVAHALEKQEQLQHQQLIYTESELKNLPFLELEEIAANLNIQDTSLCLHSEIIELILATQISLNASALPASTTTTTSLRATTSATISPNTSSIYNSQLSSAPPQPSLSPQREQPVQQQQQQQQRSEGLKDCDLCCEPMGGNAPRKMAVPPCGHLYCYTCWMEAVKRQGRCPQCSRTVCASDIRKIYV